MCTHWGHHGMSQVFREVSPPWLSRSQMSPGHVWVPEAAAYASPVALRLATRSCTQSRHTLVFTNRLKESPRRIPELLFCIIVF